MKFPCESFLVYRVAIAGNAAGYAIPTANDSNIDRSSEGSVVRGHNKLVG